MKEKKKKSKKEKKKSEKEEKKKSKKEEKKKDHMKCYYTQQSKKEEKKKDHKKCYYKQQSNYSKEEQDLFNLITKKVNKVANDYIIISGYIPTKIDTKTFTWDHAPTLMQRGVKNFVWTKLMWAGYVDCFDSDSDFTLIKAPGCTTYIKKYNEADIDEAYIMEKVVPILKR